MVRIKVCGLKRDVDISFVNELKVDYAGFVFARSKRCVTLEEAKRLVGKLHPDIKKVGVFVNESASGVKKMVRELSLDVVQLHGDESCDFADCFDVEVWKAVRIRDEHDVEKARLFNCSGILLDAFVDGVYGGTGKTINWDLVENVEFNTKVILAGGLNCENVANAIEKVRPYAVDVSSGVETDGAKDFKKMREFVRRVREYGKTII